MRAADVPESERRRHWVVIVVLPVAEMFFRHPITESYNCIFLFHGKTPG